MSFLWTLPWCVLSGCALFANGDIEKTCDEIPGCVQGAGDGGSDSGSGGDSGGGGGDSDPGDGGGDSGDAGDGGGDSGDTQPPGDPEAGVVLLGVSESRKLFGIWLYGAAGELIDSLEVEEGDPTRRYTMAWEPEEELLYISVNNYLLRTSFEDIKGKKESDYFEIGREVVALDIADSALWILSEDAIGRLQSDTYEELAAADAFIKLAGGFYSPTRGVVEVVDLDNGAPDVLALDVEAGRLNEVLTDIDDSVSRSSLPFSGPDERSFSCTSAGAVYDLETLASGDREPERLLSLSLSDIIGCGYDPGSDEVIMFSTSQGALRVAADGSSAQQALPATYTLLTGAVW